LRRRSGRAAALGLILLTATPLVAAGEGPALDVVNADSAYPEGPAVIDGDLYYAEMGNDRVMRFDGLANIVLWERAACGPTAVAAMGDGTLAVLCHREEIVARITRDGALIGTIATDPRMS
jgi:hypothetical protein